MSERFYIGQTVVGTEDFPYPFKGGKFRVSRLISHVQSQDMPGYGMTDLIELCIVDYKDKSKIGHLFKARPCFLVDPRELEKEDDSPRAKSKSKKE